MSFPPTMTFAARRRPEMAPKRDPYDTAAQRGINWLLLVFIVAIVTIVCRASAHSQTLDAARDTTQATTVRASSGAKSKSAAARINQDAHLRSFGVSRVEGSDAAQEDGGLQTFTSDIKAQRAIAGISKAISVGTLNSRSVPVGSGSGGGDSGDSLGMPMSAAGTGLPNKRPSSVAAESSAAAAQTIAQSSAGSLLMSDAIAPRGSTSHSDLSSAASLLSAPSNDIASSLSVVTGSDVGATSVGSSGGAAASAAMPSISSQSGASTAPSATGSASVSSGKPKPKPTPTPQPAPGVDGETDWKNTGTGTLDWNTAANWTAVSGSAPPAPGDVAWFKTVKSANANISASVSIAGLYFNGTGSSGYTISSTSGTPTLTLTAFGTTIGGETGNSDAVAIGAENTGGNNTVTAPIILAPASGTNSTFYQATGGTLTITGAISGSGVTLTKTGGGTLTLNTATNTYSGGTFVNSGALTFNTVNSLGAGNVTLGTSGGGDATLTSSTQTSFSNNIIVASGSGGTLTFGTTSNSGSTSTWSGTLTLNDNLAITSAQASTSNGLNLTGAISGSGGITKIGSGLLTLSSSSNSYGGNTAINAGTLKDGANNALPTGTTLTIGSAGNSALFDLNGKSQQVAGLLTAGTAANQSVINSSGTNGTLTLNVTSGTDVFGGVLGVSGNSNFVLDKEGAGTLQLTNTGNLYSLGTTINGGTLAVDNNAELGTAGVTITFGGGTLDLTAAGFSSGRTVTLNAGGGTVQVDTGTSTLSGIISGTGALTKTGPGILLLTNANTYSGGTVISGGNIQLSGGSPTGTIGSNTGTLTMTGGVFDPHGVNSAIGNLTGTGGTILNNFSSSQSVITIGNGNTGGGNFQGAIINNNTGNGTVALTKTGTGVIELSGTNTYTGATTVSGGMLALGSGNSLPGGIGNTGGTSHLTLGGGVLGASGTFSRGLGASSASTVDFNDGAGTDSGFAGFGTAAGFGGANNLAVNIGNGTALIWGGTSNGTTNFLGSGENLILGNGSANGTVDFQNNLNLNVQTDNPSNTSRIVQVDRSSVAGSSDADARISGLISGATSGGADDLIKTGTGTLQLTGANTYNGATTVSAGVLNIQNDTALGTTNKGTTVSNGATLQLQGGITVGAEGLNIRGAGATGQNGALVNLTDTNSFGGLLTLAAATTISSESGLLNLTNTGTITGATFGLTLTGSGNGALSSIVGTTSGTLAKSGNGTWTLTGSNTYTGTTTIGQGTLALGAAGTNTAGSINSTASISVSNTGTLLINGAGDGAATSRVNNSAGISLAGGTIKTAGASEAGGTFAAPTAGLGALTLTAASSLDFSATKGLLAFSGFSDAGNFLLTINNYIGQGGSSGTDRLIFGFASQAAADGSLGDFAFQNGAGTVSAMDIALGGGLWEIAPVTAVPEPGTWATAGLATLLLASAARTRLRRKTLSLSR